MKKTIALLTLSTFLLFTRGYASRSGYPTQIALEQEQLAEISISNTPRSRSIPYICMDGYFPGIGLSFRSPKNERYTQELAISASSMVYANQAKISFRNLYKIEDNLYLCCGLGGGVMTYFNFSEIMGVGFVPVSVGYENKGIFMDCGTDITLIPMRGGSLLFFAAPSLRFGYSF